MKYLFVSVVLVLLFSPSVFAHNVWLERDDNGSLRVYFGHIDGHLEKTGGRLDIIKADEVILQGKIGDRERLEDHIAIKLQGDGDVALVEKMNPRKSRKAEEIVRTIFVARAGRSETRSLLDLDLVPTVSGGNRFTLFSEGKPLAAVEIKVYDPSGGKQIYTTDKNGQITLETPQPGRYIALTAQMFARPGEVNGARYQKTRYSLALSFVKKLKCRGQVSILDTDNSFGNP